MLGPINGGQFALALLVFSSPLFTNGTKVCRCVDVYVTTEHTFDPITPPSPLTNRVEPSRRVKARPRTPNPELRNRTHTPLPSCISIRNLPQVGQLTGHDPTEWSQSALDDCLAGSTNPDAGSVVCNLKIYESAIQAAAQEGIELMVFPEAYGNPQTQIGQPPEPPHHPQIDNPRPVVLIPRSIHSAPRINHPTVSPLHYTPHCRPRG